MTMNTGWLFATSATRAFGIFQGEATAGAGAIHATNFGGGCVVLALHLVVAWTAIRTAGKINKMSMSAVSDA
jgi:hypothetical protein